MSNKFSKTLFYSFCKSAGLTRLGIFLQRKNIQLLTYHGICEKNQANGNYIPSYFVYSDEFRKQMSYLKRQMCPLNLWDAVKIIKGETALLPRSVVITFDDGYFNNLKLAVPIMKEFEIPATIFLSTDYVSTGELFPFDKRGLLSFWSDKDMISKLAKNDFLNQIPTYSSTPYKTYAESLSMSWEKHKHLLTDTQYQLLRPMSWADVQGTDKYLVSFGAHTKNHAVLASEDDEVCRDEIFSSVNLLKKQLSVEHIAFSYPVGSHSCFKENAKKLVRDSGCFCALTTISGSNPAGGNVFSLFRRPVSLNHNLKVFICELAGIREFLLKGRSLLARIRDFMVSKIKLYFLISKRFGLIACLKMLGLSLIRKICIFVKEDIYELNHQPGLNRNQQDDLAFKFVQSEDLINNRIFSELSLSKEEVLNRFASGKRCFAVWKGSEIVNVRWVDRKEFLLPGCFNLKLPKNCAYVDKGYTALKWRGRGISPTAFSKLYLMLGKEGIDIIFLYVEFENLSSVREKKKVGFRKVGFYRKIEFLGKIYKCIKVEDSRLKDILVTQGVLNQDKQ